MKENIQRESCQKRVTLETTESEIEVSWPKHQQPGFCPHCHKCIPFDSIVFKTESGSIYSGKDALKAKEKGISIEDNSAHKTGEHTCPYCHEQIPVREVVIKHKL